MSDDVRRGNWLKRSGIPARLQPLRLSEFTWGTSTDQQVHLWLRAVLDGKVINAPGQPGCGGGLLLYGKAGHGKTTLAYLLAQELLHLAPLRGVFVPPAIRRPVYVERFDGILQKQRSLIDRDSSLPAEVIRLCEEVTFGADGSVPDWTISVLVIDDLGKEHATDWTNSKFENLLRTRFDRMLPTIITTNVPPQSWAKTYGESAASFAHEAMIHVPIINSTGDRRLER